MFSYTQQLAVNLPEVAKFWTVYIIIKLVFILEHVNNAGFINVIYYVCIKN